MTSLFGSTRGSAISTAMRWIDALAVLKVVYTSTNRSGFRLLLQQQCPVSLFLPFFLFSVFFLSFFFFLLFFSSFLTANNLVCVLACIFFFFLPACCIWKMCVSLLCICLVVCDHNESSSLSFCLLYEGSARTLLAVVGGCRWMGGNINLLNVNRHTTRMKIRGSVVS